MSTNPEMGVYVVSAADGLYKIGCTANLTQRMYALGRTLGSIRLIAFIATKEYYAVERALHDLYPDKRFEGEMFSLSAEDIEYLKSLQYYFSGWLVDEIRQKAKERLPPAGNPFTQPNPAPACVLDAERRRLASYRATIEHRKSREYSDTASAFVFTSPDGELSPLE